MNVSLVPVLVACCFVLAAYLFKGRDENPENRPNYIVVFSTGFVLAFAASYFFGPAPEETINNLMKEIDMGDPGF